MSASTLLRAEMDRLRGFRQSAAEERQRCHTRIDELTFYIRELDREDAELRDALSRVTKSVQTEAVEK